jgi:hypothetical protein
MAEGEGRDSLFLSPAELSLLLLSEDVDATYRAMTRSAAAAVGAPSTWRATAWAALPVRPQSSNSR